MRAAPHPLPMDDALPPVDIDALLTEIARYLAAVATFREAGYEPRWTRERRRVQIASQERSS